MEALGVVDGFDEGADLASGVFEVSIGLAVHLLFFERLHEALVPSRFVLEFDFGDLRRD